jgi:tRNA threonylcarbamoyladenosine biosynthesis protein TsaB
MIASTMFVLGIDTSTDALSAAVCTETGPCAEITFDAGRSHAERLVETIDRVLRDAGLALRDLDLLAIAQGPGSFTGVRIGVATLKGLALGADKPLVGVSTLRAMAHAAGHEAACVCPLIDARMDEVFGAVYRRDAGSWINVTPERVGPIEALVADLPGDAVVCGDGARRYADRLRAVAPRARVLPAEQGRPSGVAVALEGLAAFRAGDAGDPARVQPVYLRQSQPEEIRRRRAEVKAHT